jgi:hypothetical protein
MSLAVPNPTGYVLQPGGAPLPYGWLAALCTAAGFFRGGHQGCISDCHFSAPLDHFIPVFRSYSVAVFRK